jgi:hypothetical protein
MTITVRRTSVQDAAALARIMGDPAVYPGLMQMPYTDEDTWRARLTESCAPGKTDLLLCAELDGKVVGSCGLHPVGLQVHDPGVDGPLEAGMVVTVEPGIYIPEESIGIRIEDVVLVTENGAKVLSAALPKEADEIEKAVAK